MGQITVSIHDHQYTLACRDGEEERLAGLASYVDGKARSLVTKLGQVSEARLLLMAALLIADELQDVHDQAADGGQAGATPLSRSGMAVGGDAGMLVDNQDLAARIDAVTERLAGIAASLESA